MAGSKKKNPGGRPTLCTVEITQEICKRLADGESLISICKDDHIPEKSSVLYWVVEDRIIEGTDEKFSDHYMRAREAQGFSHADEALELRNEIKHELVDPNAARVMLDALKWGAERMAPKKHSARQVIDHTSEDGTMSPSKFDDSELDERIKELEAKLSKS